MRWVGITSIGTYWSPWFPYSLASFYFCDEIVVVNGGYNLEKPSLDQYNVPIEEASRTIRELDIAGKIHEIRGWTIDSVKKKATLARQSDKLEGDWYDVRGLVGTLANETAIDLGAEMILKWDSDQVGYRDAIQVTLYQRGLVLYQYEFEGDLGHLADPGPDDPYNDSVFSYRAGTGQWYYGGMGPVLHADRFPCPSAHCAHLRHANPPDLSEQAKFQHFYGRLWFRYMTNEGLWGEPLKKKAQETALQLLRTRGKRSFQQPPETCLTSPLSYIREEYG